MLGPGSITIRMRSRNGPVARELHRTRPDEKLAQIVLPPKNRTIATESRVQPSFRRLGLSLSL